MLSEGIAILSLIPMFLYIFTRKRFLGLVSWSIFAIATALKAIDFANVGDYYNTGVFILASLFFLLLANAIFVRNSQTLVETTAFSALACAIYFPFAFIDLLNDWIIRETANLSAIVGRALGFPVSVDGRILELNGSYVEIILACTAIESISLFTGAIFGIKAEFSRKLKAFFVSVPVIYLLNLLRNVFVLASYSYSWFGENSFYIAHHIISKILATLALVIIAFIVFKILPELAELIYSLKDEILKGVGVDREKRI
ncbi:MAG: archaeosortase A [Archaeoglobales archaeon]|nr:archaeosortase A [Archaeoglobales archaeon]